MIARWIIRLAPPPLRDLLEADGVLTMADVRAADADRGRTRSRLVGVLDLLDLFRAVMRARLGRRTPITHGRAPQPPHRRKESPMTRWSTTFRHAWRGLFASRGAAAVAAVTLALGIGVNTAVFSILDSILFRPVPYADGDRLREMWSYYAPGKFQMQGQFTPPMVVEWRKQTDLFDRVEASEPRSFIYADRTGAEMVSGSAVTPGLLPMLGVAPRLGRLFTGTDGRDGSDRFVVVSYRFWQERLGRDPDAVGRRITLDDEAYEIVGVMPAGFRYPDASHELWIPLDAVKPPAWTATKTVSFAPVVRLRAGLTIAEAESHVAARGEEINRTAGGDGKSSARLAGFGDLLDERTSRSLWVLGGAVVFLLLIVCANVANLTLARSMARARDLAVRSALGASRGELFRVVLLEHAMLGVAGAALGLLLAQAALGIVVATLPEVMTRDSLNVIDLDWRAMAFLASCTVGTVLMFGVPPALMATRTSIATVLSQQSRSSTGSPAARRFRAALVVVEVALSIVLLVGAALMTRSLMKLQSIDIGMDPEGLIAMRLALPSRGYEDPMARDIVTEEIVRRARLHAGVSAASAGHLPPTESLISVGALEFSDRAPGPDKPKSTLLRVYSVWPGYFAAAGIPLIEGREPTERDAEGAAVVSKGFADKHWPGRSPIGVRFRLGKNPWRTVVGVAAEVRRMSENDDSTEHEAYYPHDQVNGVMHRAEAASTIAEYRTIIVRADRPGAVGRDLTRIAHDVDPRIVVSSTRLVAHQFADAIARPRIVFLMMAVFAGVGLVLAAAGLYAVLSYLVSLRQREIGVRLALGASPRDIANLVFSRGLGLAAIGLVLGLGAAAALVKVMQAILYDVAPSDPLAITGAVAVILITAIAASLLPARRAMRIDPVALLRE